MEAFKTIKGGLNGGLCTQGPTYSYEYIGKIYENTYSSGGKPSTVGKHGSGLPFRSVLLDEGKCGL